MDTSILTLPDIYEILQEYRTLISAPTTIINFYLKYYGFNPWLVWECILSYCRLAFIPQTNQWKTAQTSRTSWGTLLHVSKLNSNRFEEPLIVFPSDVRLLDLPSNLYMIIFQVPWVLWYFSNHYICATTGLRESSLFLIKFDTSGDTWFRC